MAISVRQLADVAVSLISWVYRPVLRSYSDLPDGKNRIYVALREITDVLTRSRIEIGAMH
jgi:hypothetical protein